MKRLLMFAIGTLATFQLSAQQHVHLSVNSGIGKIGFKLYPGELTSSTRLEDRYFATFGMNLSYSYQFGDFSVESGLSYNELKGYQTDGTNLSEMAMDGSYRIVKKDIITERKAHYLTVPLKLNYRIDKLQIGVGAYISSLISDQYNAVAYTDGLYTGSSNARSGLKNLDFGVSAQVEYELSERASLLFSTNLGLENVNPGSYPLPQFTPDFPVEVINRRELRNRQYMLGLKFRLYKS